ncbi:MAG TPA: serine hydrolase domain-containing protein [Candidatus Binatia bacterium]|nr:serine hydrolase domain-containing protein [Candidatus Binatia bacterium]
MMSRLAVLSALILACAADASASPRSQRDPGAIVQGAEAARIDSFMTAAAGLGLEGTLLVEREGKVILVRGYGIADRGRRIPATTRTPYVLGSLSKQFTAAAAYQLESRGKLRLSDSLGRWFPDAPEDKRGITVDQLIHHTSGLPYLGRGDLYDSISVDSMVRETFSYPLEFAPGSRYEYSSPGYDLLAVVIERASGRGFNDYLRQELFQPAGMTETGFIDEPSRWPVTARTPSYSSSEADPPLYPVRLAPKTVGSGSVVSTCGDLWKWEQALRAGTVLDAEATRKLFTPGPASGPTSFYAGGWQVVQSQRGTTVILHAGDLGGFNTDMRRMVDEHATIIFLSNAREGGRGYRDIAPIMATRILFGPQPELPQPLPRVSRGVLARWNGSVALDPGVMVSARVRDGAVWLTARTQEGIFRITGADSAARARALTLNGLAAAVADSLLRGSAHSLDSIFSPSLVEGSHPEFFRIWRATADSAGTPARAEVIGTIPSTPASARTLVRISGGRGAIALTLDWLGGRLIGSASAPDDGLTLRFGAESADRAARYDLWAGRTIRVTRS